MRSVLYLGEEKGGYINMKCSNLLKDLLAIIGTSKFASSKKYCEKQNEIDLKKFTRGDSYFYNRLKQKRPIIASTIVELRNIYDNILWGKTGFSEQAISKSLSIFFEKLIGINTDYFVFYNDDSTALRREKISLWNELIQILLKKAENKEEVEFCLDDFRAKLECQQKAVENFCAGTHTEVILNDKAETSEADEKIKEFYCGLYYCYYAASDSEGKIRGGKLRIYEKNSKLKVKLILRISEDYLLDDSKLDEILECSDSGRSHEELRKYKIEEIENGRYDAGRCEIYEGDFKVFRNHIRIDLRHAERGYSGFILLHRIDSATQRNLQGCLAYLMNIPDGNSIYIRKLGISLFKFSLENQELWKHIGVSHDEPFMEISKSHKDNNHLFYTFVWENMIKSKRKLE